jgi:hypothetical protein
VREDGAVSDSGLRYFDPAAGIVELALPPPPEAGAEPLTARASDLCEHLLVRVDPELTAATTIRVLTTDQSAARPDLARVGLPPLAGRYAWSVRTWPGLRLPDQLSGTEARAGLPSAVSAPREIVVE